MAWGGWGGLSIRRNNRHYVTAGFQFISQLVIYSFVYFVGLPPGGIILAALALQSPFLLASMATLVALFLQRPYLRRGRVVGVRQMMAPTRRSPTRCCSTQSPRLGLFPSGRLFGIAAAALSSHWLSPVRVIDVLFVSMGIGLPALLVVADVRYKRERRDTVT